MMRTPLPDAIRRDGSPVYAAACSTATWDTFKAEGVADPNAFRMPCCGARAVLKTSLYGVQFAAHYSNECDTAPETLWHIAAKDAVLAALSALGVPARQEVSGGSGQSRWKADVLAEVGSRRIAFELQRSYQHFREFERRQERYRLDGVECFWLVRREASASLLKAIARRRIREEFGGRFPADGFFSNLPGLPWGFFEPATTESIWMPPMRATVPQWVAAIVAGKLIYDLSDKRGIWKIAG